METDERRAPRHAGPNQVAGGRLRTFRAHRRSGGHVLLRSFLVGLTLTLLGTVSAAAPQAGDQVLGLVRDLAGPRREQALEALEEIRYDVMGRVAGPDSSREDWMVFLYTTVLIGDDSEDPEVLATALGEINGFERGARDLAILADVAYRAGLLNLADEAARLGIESRGYESAWRSTALLCYIRAEVARKEGRRGDVDEHLNLLESKLPNDETLRNLGYEAMMPRNWALRSLLHVSRARSLLEIGVLDRVREEVSTAKALAVLSEDINTLAAVRNLEIDLATLAQDFRGGAELAAASAKDESFAALEPGTRAIFQLAEGVARCELDRRQKFGIERGEPADFEQSLGVRALEQVLTVEELAAPAQLKALVALADAALQRDLLDVAEAYLQQARELGAAIEETGPLTPLDDKAHASALAWHCAFRGGGECTEALSELENSYRAVLRQWASTEVRRGGIGFMHLSWRTHLLGTLIDARLVQEPGSAGAERALRDVLESQELGSRVRERGLTPVSLAEIRSELLEPGRAILMLLPGRDRSHLFVLAGDTIHVEPLASFGELRILARPVLSTLRDSSATLSSASLRNVRDALLPPTVLERLGEWEELYLIGFDRVDGLPPALLPGIDDVPLGESHAICHLPSLPLGVDIVRRARRNAEGWEPSLDLALLVNPDPHGIECLQQLPFGDEEASRLTMGFSRDQVFVKRPANIQDFSEVGIFERARVTEFLTHGAYDAQRERGAVLVFGGGDEGLPAFFGAQELNGRGAAGVFLIASCNAAKGPQRLGDDTLANLGGALLDEGAAAVFLSRFPVEFEPTIALFELIHRHLLNGASLAEAHRRARESIASRDSSSEPTAGYRRTSYEVIGAGFLPPFDIERR